MQEKEQVAAVLVWPARETCPIKKVLSNGLVRILYSCLIMCLKVLNNKCLMSV